MLCLKGDGKVASVCEYKMKELLPGWCQACCDIKDEVDRYSCTRVNVQTVFLHFIPEKNFSYLISLQDLVTHTYAERRK